MRHKLRAITSAPVLHFNTYAPTTATRLALVLSCLALTFLPGRVTMGQSSAAVSNSSSAEATADQQKLRLELRGLNNELHNQVLNFLGDSRTMDADDIPAHVETLQKKAAKALQASGYYNSHISAKHASYKNNTTIALQIDAGPPVLIREVEINLNADAAELSDFKQTLGQLGLVRNQVFNHEDYEQAKSSLLKTAQLLGFFDATFARSQVLVTRSDNSADIYLDLNTGKRYSISQVVYKQDLYPEAFMERWQDFKVSVPYRANYVSDLTVNLQNSGYFKHVRVVPDLQLAVDHKLPLIIDLEPAEENTVGVGVGYATDSGPRLKSNWLRPHTNKLGHALEAKASVSGSRQDFSLSYRIPHSKKPASNHYSIDTGVLNFSTDDTYSQLRTLEIGDHRLTRNKWRRDLFLRYENERFNVGGNKDAISLVLPGIGFSRVVSKGGINPEQGKYLSFQLMAARRSLFSDIDMLRATGAAKILKSWERKHYFITRAEFGALKTDSFEDVPATHRFFAGGDNSVRGFSYQYISPKNLDNESTGGQFLTTASIEYNRYLTDKFAIAAFVDSGRAFNDSAEPTRTGIGIGLRWRSPVGPLRIDLAHGIDNEDSPYRIHLAIGPEL